MQELFNFNNTKRWDFFNKEKVIQKQAKIAYSKKENQEEAKCLEGSFRSIETNRSWIILSTLVISPIKVRLEKRKL